MISYFLTKLIIYLILKISKKYQSLKIIKCNRKRKEILKKRKDINVVAEKHIVQKLHYILILSKSIKEKVLMGLIYFQKLCKEKEDQKFNFF